GDGFFSAAVPNAAATGWHALLQFGTVLQPGEDLHSRRVLETAGTGVVVAYHGMFEGGGPDTVRQFPGGAAWLEGLPAQDAHLFTHQGHLVELTDRDRAALAAGGSDLVGSFTLTGTADELR